MKAKQMVGVLGKRVPKSLLSQDNNERGGRRSLAFLLPIDRYLSHYYLAGLNLGLRDTVLFFSHSLSLYVPSIFYINHIFALIVSLF